MKAAVPLVKVAVPIWLVAFQNVTVPVGVPLPEAGATVAVITTGPLDPT